VRACTVTHLKTITSLAEMRQKSQVRAPCSRQLFVATASQVSPARAPAARDSVDGKPVVAAGEAERAWQEQLSAALEVSQDLESQLHQAQDHIVRIKK
jgi:hypothetical protein